MALLAAEIAGDEIPLLDVHGLNVDEAKKEVLEFLCREHAGSARQNIKAVKIITGRGSGRLYFAILSYLKTKPVDFLESVRGAESSNNIGAVILAVLAPNK